MKIGHDLRKRMNIIKQKFMNLINECIFLYYLLFNKKTKGEYKFKNLIFVYGGATGDFYNILGILNQLEKVTKSKIFLYSLKRNEKFVKNPKIHFIDFKKLEEFLKDSQNIVFIFDIGLLKKEEILKINKGNSKIALFTFVSPKGLLKHILIPLKTDFIFPFKNRNAIEDFIEILQKTGFKIKKELRFYFPKNEKEIRKNFEKKYNIRPKDKILFFHVGSAKLTRALKEGKPPSSYWPEENWIELSNNLLSKNKNLKIIFTGVENERKIIEKILESIHYKNQVINIAGRYSIEEVASILKIGRAVVSLDTAMAHIAAQTNVPIIDLMGFYSPRYGAPIAKKKIVLFHKEVCNHCRNYFCKEGKNICMRTITPNEVYLAIKKFVKIK